MLLVEKFSGRTEESPGTEREPTRQLRVRRLPVEESTPPGRSVPEPSGDTAGPPDDAVVRVELGGTVHDLSRAEAATLREQLRTSLTERREFVRTVGEHRADGAYVVSRRGAESSGHRKVFDGFDALVRLYEGLPTEFTAETVGRGGLTGGRRHMLLRHLVEHPSFDCELVARQPLTARKRGPARAEDVATVDD